MERDTEPQLPPQDHQPKPIHFKQKWAVLLICVGLLTTGCGRKWEQLWGQDTRPETRYIPLTPDVIDIAIGSVEPVQWADRRFRDARYLSVWACNDNNMCLSIPEDRPDGDAMTVYVVNGYEGIAGGCLLVVYNVHALYPAATKVRVQLVM